MNSYNFYGKNSQKNDKSRENPGRNNKNWDNFNRYLKYQSAPGQYYPMNYPFWYFPMWYYPQGQQSADSHESYSNPYSCGFPFPPYPNKNPNAESTNSNAPTGSAVNILKTNAAAATNNVDTPDTNTSVAVNSPIKSDENINEMTDEPVTAPETVKREESKKAEENENPVNATESTAEKTIKEEENTQHDYIVHNVVEYFNAVEIAYIQLGVESGTNLWFRGSESDTYSLLPEVARKPYNVNIEKTFMSQFKPKAAPYISSYQEINLVYNDDSYIAALFLMKRFGIPTRLLSWTEDAIAALFFAVNNMAVENENPVVWCLDPVKLNMTYKIGKSLGCIPSAAERKVTEIFGSQKNSGLSKPCAVYSPFLSADIIAQKETFTIFPFNTELKPLENLPDSNEYLYKITIDRSMSDTIAAQLKRYGFSKELLMRGIETVAENLMNDDEI